MGFFHRLGLHDRKGIITARWYGKGQILPVCGGLGHFRRARAIATVFFTVRIIAGTCILAPSNLPLPCRCGRPPHSVARGSIQGVLRAMALFLEFLTEQWIVATALIVCIILLIKHESRKGGPTLSPQQVINLVNREQAVVVDLRDSKEFQQGHIVDALNIPHAKLAERVAELESYRDKPLILVCKMGQHSGAAGKTLAAKGFEQVSRLSGGMMEWQTSQLPVVVK